MIIGLRGGGESPSGINNFASPIALSFGSCRYMGYKREMCSLSTVTDVPNLIQSMFTLLYALLTELETLASLRKFIVLVGIRSFLL